MNQKSSYQIVLGSKSPRRSQLLTNMGFTYTLRTEDTDESFDSAMNAFDVAEHLAIRKSKAINIKENELLLTADSVVILKDQIIGKPEDEKQAKEYVERLSGTKHFVSTGVALRSLKNLVSFAEVAEVDFAVLSKEEIHYYIEHFKPLDKAGSYGIQDWIGMNKVTKIKGTYTNIMGLPTARVYKEIIQF